jgi:hypothetical protein
MPGPQSHTSVNPGPDVILVAIEPFRVGDLAALQLDGDAGDAGQNDLDITAAPTADGPGLHPGREPLIHCPAP